MKPTPYRALLAAAVLAAAPAAAPQDAPPPTPPAAAASPSPPPGSLTFPAQVEQVIVDVVVTDKKGEPIKGIGLDEFVVLEDGEAQRVVSFEAVTVPEAPAATPAPRPRVASNKDPDVQTGRTFTIVFDDIHLTPFQANRAKAAVVQFLTNGVREGDRVSLVATGGGAWWSTRMEAGREELIAMVKRLEGRHIPDRSPERMSEYEAMRIHVYHDRQVEQRVSRRFETYGVAHRSGLGSERQFETGDPYVRARASEVYFQSVARNRITLQILERILDSHALVKGRKSLVLVSEGFIYDPNLDEFKQTIQAARRANVAIYFVDTRGLEGMPLYATAEFGPLIDNQDVGAAFMDNLQAAEGAESLAADSGGFTVKNTNDLSKGIQRIADESRSYYLLGYNPSNTRADGRFRKIEVKVARKGLKVRARRGYYAPLEGARRAERKGGPDPDIQAALDSPYERDQVPLRMTAYVFDETLLNKASVIVVADVDVSGFDFQEAGGRFVDTLDFMLVVAHRETGEYFPYNQSIEMKLLPATHERLLRTGYPVVRDFELAPGGYQAKLVVRGKNSGRVGSLIHEFEVPDLGSLRVSTPLLSDTVQSGPDGSGPPRPVPVARRFFPAGARLYCSFEVYGAAKDGRSGMPRVRAGYSIRKRDGGIFTHEPPSLIAPTSLGKLSRLVITGLDGASPGDYEVVLTLTDEIAGKSLEVREPFTIQPPSTASTGG